MAHYIGRRGTKRVAKAVLIGAVPPVMLKSDKNPDGVPISVFDDIRAAYTQNRSQFYMDLTLPFYGYNWHGAKRAFDVIAVRQLHFMKGTHI